MLVWKTCLRTIRIAWGDEERLGFSGEEFRSGAEAYQFLLEVACGLHSPLLGETEVMGQFREFIEKSSAGAELRRVLQQVLVDAKAVRSKHLTDLGSQSYGSLSRKHLKRWNSTLILGSGQLAREILPWIMKKSQVRVVARNPEKARDLSQTFPNVSVESYSSHGELLETLVVAAPLTNAEIRTWLERHPNWQDKIQLVIDLRGESKTDPLGLPVPVVTLSQLFEQLEVQRSRIQNKAKAARIMIARLAEEMLQKMEHRPFGWDDLCA